MNSQNKHIILTIKSKHQLTLAPHQIIRCEANSNYTIIHHQAQQYIISKNLREVSQVLNQQPIPFVRVHQSHLINLHQLKSIHKGKQWQLTMKDGSIINVSRRNHQYLLAQLNQYYLTL